MLRAGNVTVSTVGVVERRQLGGRAARGLALSLHAPDQAKRETSCPPRGAPHRPGPRRGRRARRLRLPHRQGAPDHGRVHALGGCNDGRRRRELGDLLENRFMSRLSEPDPLQPDAGPALRPADRGQRASPGVLTQHGLLCDARHDGQRRRRRLAWLLRRSAAPWRIGRRGGPRGGRRPAARHRAAGRVAAATVAVARGGSGPRRRSRSSASGSPWPAATVLVGGYFVVPDHGMTNTKRCMREAAAPARPGGRRRGPPSRGGSLGPIPGART